MELLERCYKTLVVSSAMNFSRDLKTLFPKSMYHVDTAKTAGEARRKLLEKDYDFVIVNAPLSDEFGTRLSIDMCADAKRIAMMFVSNDVFDEIYAKVSPMGVFVLKKPTSPSVAEQSLSMLCSARERLRRIEKKTQTLENKMKEIRIVNRAKWALIENEKMTEDEAHRLVEKTAMDAGITKKAAAQIIIEKYE